MICHHPRFASQRPMIVGKSKDNMIRGASRGYSPVIHPIRIGRVKTAKAMPCMSKTTRVMCSRIASMGSSDKGEVNRFHILCNLFMSGSLLLFIKNYSFPAVISYLIYACSFALCAQFLINPLFLSCALYSGISISIRVPSPGLV